jgi:hypothetical protein
MDQELPTAAEAVAATCPPHHWLVEDDPRQGDQHWICQRCGAERVQAPPRKDGMNWHRAKLRIRRPRNPDAAP